MNQNDEKLVHEMVRSFHPELKRLIVRASCVGLSSSDSRIGSLSRLINYKTQKEHESLFCEHDYGTIFPYDTLDWLKPIADFCDSFLNGDKLPHHVSLHLVENQNIAILSCKEDEVLLISGGESPVIALAKLCKRISDAVSSKT